MRFLECAKIVSTHGLKGEVKIKIITNDLSRFDKDSILFVGDKKEKIIIDSYRPIKDMGLIAFNKIDNINNVLDYVGKTIYCDSDMYDSDDIYYDDLIGCKIIENSTLIGEVIDVMEVPQGAILRVQKKDGKNALIPYVEEFIKDVDIDKKEIIIESIEGLI